MGLRVAFLAAECEPWAKTGGLADVVDALARALGLPEVDGVDGPVDVFLPRYQAVPAPDPGDVLGETMLAVPDPRARTGSSQVTITDVAGNGYRLRLIDHPPAFDRAGLYGDATGDYADNAWRFGLYCRAALEALRADGRPLDVLHLHDWQAGPAAIFRDLWYADSRRIAVGPACQSCRCRTSTGRPSARNASNAARQYSPNRQALSA